ncbi:MAG: RNA polymerase sigma factor, partial [Acidobacteriota bacterium]|nr:RNA polymerase sigma factor [Acidobacteriota bacterium]
MLPPEPPDDFEQLRIELVRAIRRICPRDLADCAEDLVQAALIRVLEIWRKSEGTAQFNKTFL